VAQKIVKFRLETRMFANRRTR